MLEMYTIRYVVMCDTVVCTSKWHSTSTVSETSTILDNVYDFISKWNWLKWKIYSATMKLFDFHSFVSFVKHHLCGIYYRYSFSLHTHVLIKMGWHWCIQRSYIIYRQLRNLFFYLFKHFITNWNGKMKAYICIITIWYTLCHISCGLNRSINWCMYIYCTSSESYYEGDRGKEGKRSISKYPYLYVKHNVLRPYLNRASINPYWKIADKLLLIFANGIFIYGIWHCRQFIFCWFDTAHLPIHKYLENGVAHMRG